LQLSPRARARGLRACAEEAGLKAGRAVQVDDDLAALKGLVGGSSAPKSLTSGDGGGAVDDELQKYARAPERPARPGPSVPALGAGAAADAQGCCRCWCSVYAGGLAGC